MPLVFGLPPKFYGKNSGRDSDGKGIMNILHIAKTPVAGAPGIISDIINRYTNHNSYVYVENKSAGVLDFSCDYIKAITYGDLDVIKKEVDIIHFHNTGPKEFGIGISKKRTLIQLHSEPALMGRLIKSYPGVKIITIAQKHALLYEDLDYVPNLVPLWDEKYMPSREAGEKINVFYAPSTTHDPDNYGNTCRGKGYKKTVEILKNIENLYGDRVSIIIMTGKPKCEILSTKRTADIVIDECVTGGYHLASLEGLSMGCATLAYLTPEVQNVIRKVTGAEENAWCSTHINALEWNLKLLIGNKELCRYIGRESRAWMEKYWAPEKMVQKYIDIYKGLLDGNI